METVSDSSLERSSTLSFRASPGSRSAVPGRRGICFFARHFGAVAALLFIVLFVMAGGAKAHHGYALFDTSTQKTVSGTVRKFIWMNPHTWLWLDVKNSQGGVDAWGFEGMSPNYLGRRGWTRTSLKPGDPITVTFYPFKKADQHGGAFLSAKRPNGEELKMYLQDPAEQ